MSETYSGSCNCGKVTYKVEGPLRGVVACHCSQCRKQSGHYYAATSASDHDLTISGENNITWYEASDDARRGFCRHCGSALFWKANGEDKTSILAGSLEDGHNLQLLLHIFAADKGAYYELNDGVEARCQGRNSALYE